MRTTLLVCACLASIAWGQRLLAQDAGPTYDGDDAAPYGAPADEATGDDGPTCDEGACDGAYDGPPLCAVPACGGPPCDGPCPYNQAPGLAYYQRRAAILAGCDPCATGAGHFSHLKALHTRLHNHCVNKCNKHHHCNGNMQAQRRAALTPWHGDYYYPQWGAAPVALVVPPTAEFQSKYSWGVPSYRMTPIDHQFSRNYFGTSYGGFGRVGFLPPPYYPDSTDQFGVYYVRGPW